MDSNQTVDAPVTAEVAGDNTPVTEAAPVVAEVKPEPKPKKTKEAPKGDLVEVNGFKFYRS